MNTRVIEIVTFKLAKGISEAEFLATLPAVNAFITACDGFIARRLSKDDDGLWTDHLEWTDMAAAKAASDQFPQQQGLGPFMTAMDMQSVKMSHNHLQLSLG